MDDKDPKNNKDRLSKNGEVEQIKQSFSHGRSRSITLEVKRKRAPLGIGAKPTADDDNRNNAANNIKKPSGLTNQEWESRLKAVRGIKKEDKENAPALIGGVLVEEAQKARAEAAQKHEKKKSEEKPQRTEKHEDNRKSDKDFKKHPPKVEAASEAPKSNDSSKSHESSKPQDLSKPHKKNVDEDSYGKAAKAVKHDPKKGEGKNIFTKHKRVLLDVALDGEEGGFGFRGHRKRPKHKSNKFDNSGEQIKIVREVIIPEMISVQDLANRMSVRGAEVVKSLMNMGMIVTINQMIDADTAEILVSEFGHKASRVKESDVEVAVEIAEDTDVSLLKRPPVVTVMGHVDHGKTSLLDALRSTDVVSGEAGGITQHIGAYQVTTKEGNKITFIDTPGHAAFTEMRARGANITDIVILVVAADDGIMAQTIEAIHHAQAANVPIVVAINKIDKPEANPDRVRMELLAHNIIVEKMGGEVMDVEVSAKARMNLEKLEEAVLLQAEILNLKANPNRLANGVVVEAKMDKGRGAVATVLVQGGTLRVGDIFVVGSTFGRVRALIDDKGNKVLKAIPGTPVEVIGLDEVPSAGDLLVVATDESKAREVAAFRGRVKREQKIALANKMSAQDLLISVSEKKKALAVIIKGDVQGSLEALQFSLGKLANEEVEVRVLHSAVGGINESDVSLAMASNAIIIGFNVRAYPQARELASKESVDIRYYSIIYNVIEDIKSLLGGILSPIIKEEILGYARIRQVFSISKVGKVAGCIITEGIVKRGAKVRLLRDSVVIHEGSLSTLKRMKDDAKEVREGYECGMTFEHYNDIQENDVVECYELLQVARQL